MGTFILLTFFPVLLAYMLYGIKQLRYEVDDDSLRIRWGRRTIRTIPMEDIAGVEPRFGLWMESWVTSAWPTELARRSVTVYRSSGRFRRILLTPEDPVAFVAELRARRSLA